MKFRINNLFNKKKLKLENNILLYILKIILAVIIIFFTIYLAHSISNIIQKIKFYEKNEKKKEINKEKNHMSVILSIFVKYTIYFLGIYSTFKTIISICITITIYSNTLIKSIINPFYIFSMGR